MQFLNQLGQLQGQNDPTEALQMADRIPPGNARQTYLHALISGLASQDGELAAEYATALPLGENQASVIHSVASQWSYRDPAAAMKWVSSLPDNQTVMQAQQQVVSQWINADSDAAKEWLVSQPAGPRRDQLLQGTIGNLAYQQPQEAVRMLEMVSGSEMRSQMARQVAEAWLRQDRAAAESWINTQSLPAEVKQQLLNPSTSGYNSSGGIRLINSGGIRH